MQEADAKGPPAPTGDLFTEALSEPNMAGMRTPVI